jgi:dienelactone hydrolase
MAAVELNYKDSEGTSLRGRLALPVGKTGHAPAVIIVHEAFGLLPEFVQRAERLADMGYAALAVDMFGDARTAANLQDGMALVNSVGMDSDRMLDRMQAAVTAIKQHPGIDPTRIGAMGYCFGGTCALKLALGGGDIRGVVSFHGSLTVTPTPGKTISSAILVCHGDSDPVVPTAQLDAFREILRQVGTHWQINIYGGAKHGFTNPEADKRGVPAIGYDRVADAASWAAMTAFFADVFRQWPRTSGSIPL